MTQAEVLAQWEARENDRRDTTVYRIGTPSELAQKLLLKAITSPRRRRERFAWHSPTLDDMRTEWRLRKQRYRSKQRTQ